MSPDETAESIEEDGQPVTLPDGSVEPMILDERPEAAAKEFAVVLDGEVTGRVAVAYARHDTAVKNGDELVGARGARWRAREGKDVALGTEVLCRVFLLTAGSVT